MGSPGLAIVARTDFEATTVPQLIALAKAKPDTITMQRRVGSPGPGGLFQGTHGRPDPASPTRVTADPERPPGTPRGPGIADDTRRDSQVKSSKAKAVAVTSAHRSSQMPDVPTVAEAGVSGYAAEIWNILVVPA
jgi:tripartite-type tricarboxylate transporter receptor subunit TctC